MRHYERYEEKMQDGYRYQQDEEIPWPVLVDDLVGTVHQVYGALADPTYLIDADGYVAFYNMWTYAPTLYEAIEALMKQGWRGVVKGGIDHVPYMQHAISHGWRGLERGLPQSFTDLMTAAPGTASVSWLAYQIHPLLAPLTQRARPLPTPVKLGMTTAALLVLWMIGNRFQGDAEPEVTVYEHEAPVEAVVIVEEE